MVSPTAISSPRSHARASRRRRQVGDVAVEVAGEVGHFERPGQRRRSGGCVETSSPSLLDTRRERRDSALEAYELEARERCRAPRFAPACSEWTAREPSGKMSCTRTVSPSALAAAERRQAAWRLADARARERERRGSVSPRRLRRRRWSRTVLRHKIGRFENCARRVELAAVAATAALRRRRRRRAAVGAVRRLGDRGGELRVVVLVVGCRSGGGAAGAAASGVA